MPFAPYLDAVTYMKICIHTHTDTHTTGVVVWLNTQFTFTGATFALHIIQDSFSLFHISEHLFFLFLFSVQVEHPVSNGTPLLFLYLCYYVISLSGILFNLFF